MSGEDYFWFRVDKSEIFKLRAEDFIDFNNDDYADFDAGKEFSIKIKNATIHHQNKSTPSQNLLIPVRFNHFKGDAVALSKNGWRPLMFIPNNSTVIFDKNAFATINKHINKDGTIRHKDNMVIGDFFKSRQITVDAKAILLEGNNRRTKTLPSLEEMSKELEEFRQKLSDRVPNLKLKTTDESIQWLHQARTFFLEGLESAITFLERGYQHYIETKTIKPAHEHFNDILAIAKTSKLHKSLGIFVPIVFKAISGRKNNKTFKLLKFNKNNYISEGLAFNAALDIYSLILFLSEIRNHGHHVYFITADKDLIHLWNDLIPYLKVDDQPGELAFSIEYCLSELGDAERAKSTALMVEYFKQS